MTAAVSLALRERLESTIRCLVIDAVEAAQSGHPGAPMGLARPVLELWLNHLRFDPADPAWPLRDRFVLSAGHASMLHYALLHLFGFDLPLDEIRKFRQLGSLTPGHPEYGHTAGVEVTTGPLGQGLAHAVGMALAAARTRARFGADRRGPGHHHVYAIVSDGDLMEGVSYEAASLAGHLGLGALIVLYDDNAITIDGAAGLSFSEDVNGRFAAQGWHVQAVDGEDVAGLAAALAAARTETGRPSLIRMRTVIGRGSSTLAGSNKTHGAPLGTDEAVATKAALGFDPAATFVVPDDVAAALAEDRARRAAARADADATLAAWRTAEPALAADWDACRRRALPDDLEARLLAGMAGKSDATRKHGAAVLTRVAEALPYTIGGSADLAGSAAPPIIKDLGILGQGQGDGRYLGRNIHFGVREHAMAAIANGLNLDGTGFGYCGTFLVFSDYMRPAIRLAAIMKLKTVFVFTHDSLFVGEDGPTHQPIEHVDALRSIPGLTVFRPVDGVETAMAWAWTLREATGPVAFILTRQGVEAPVRPDGFDPAVVLKGGYAVHDPAAKPAAVLVASGSEVALALAAARQLAARGTAVRVVSVPSLDLLQRQPADYIDALVPDDGTPLISVEAGRGESLRWLIGRRGLNYGMCDFGASAPSAALAEAFGFTAEALAAAVERRLAAA